MNDVPIDTHRAVLADGSKVDLETTEGADAFLKEYPNFFSKHSGTANVYRQLLASVGKHKYGGKNDIVRMLKQVYRVAGALAANASEKAVGNLDTTELETFVLHIESVLKALTTQDEWTCTGVFNRCDSVMIGALAQLIHRGVADTFVEEKYCTLVADVVASAKRCATRLPSAESFFYMIAPIVHLLFAGEKKTETQMRLARSGLLTQFVRFLTHPKLEPASGEEISKQVIGVCMTAPFLIKEVFHTSRPGGKILRDVLAGKDGHPGDRSPEATALLHALVQMADWTNMFYNTSPCVVCSNKSRKPVLCSRCKDGIFYCSTKCVDRGRKYHEQCSETPHLIQKKMDACNASLARGFIYTYYYDIMKRIDFAVYHKHCPKKNLLLWLNFCSPITHEEPAPALKDPPEITLAPDFFPWLTSNGRMPNEAFEALEKERAMMTDDCLLVKGEYPVPSKKNAIEFFRAQPKTTLGVSIFSDQAMEAFHRFLEDGNPAHLDAVYGAKQKKRILDAHTKARDAAPFDETVDPEGQTRDGEMKERDLMDSLGQFHKLDL